MNRRVMAILSLMLLAAAVFTMPVESEAAPPEGTAAAPSGTPQRSAPSVTPGSSPATSANSGQPIITDIHDIRQPLQIGVNPALYYWGLGGVLSMLLIGLLVYLWRRWRSRKAGLPPEIVATIYETPEEEALRRLAELEEQEKKITPVQYYFLLSALFRRWIQRRFDIDAPEMTTEELLPAMIRIKNLLPMFSDVKSFFLFADQVKFARAGCETQTMRQHHQLVRDAVKQASTESVENSEEKTTGSPTETTENLSVKKLAERV